MSALGWAIVVAVMIPYVALCAYVLLTTGKAPEATVEDFNPGDVAWIRIRDRYEGYALMTQTRGWAWVPYDCEAPFGGVAVASHATEIHHVDPRRLS